MENKDPAEDPASSPYPPLGGERAIRLATIHPGSWADEVRCKLTSWLLDSAQRPEYQALSYAWGSAHVTEEIFLNDQPLQVTVNLACALRYLRHSSYDVTFWIDALCINQQDLEERGVQVPLIRDIYSRAVGLTIFLGNGVSHRTPRAFHRSHTPSAAASHDFSSGGGARGPARDRQVVADFWDSWRNRRRRTGDKPSHRALSVFCLLWSLAYDMSTTQTWPPPELLDPGREPDVRDLFEAVRQMLLSPWWNRIWVVQEVAVARGPVTLRFGDASAPWDLLVRAARHPCLLPEPEPQPTGEKAQQQQQQGRQLQTEYAKVLQLFARVVRNIEALRTRWLDGGGAPMLSLLQEFGYRDATDERDKVYALMGLASASGPHAIHADYAMSVKDVYKQVALFFLESTPTLAFLTGNQTRKNRRDLPSWVPDWGAIVEPGDRARAAVIDLYDAHRAATTKEPRYITTPGCDVLGIRSRVIDKAEAVGDRLITWDGGGENYALQVVYSWIVVASNPRGVLHVGEQLRVANALVGGLRAEDSEAGESVRYARLRSQTAPEHENVQLLHWFVTHLAPAIDGAMQGTPGYIPLAISLREAAMILPPSLDGRPLGATYNPRHFNTAMKLATEGRTFFKTADGYMGLGPSSMLPGDHIYTLRSGQTHMVLRHTSTRMEYRPYVAFKRRVLQHGCRDYNSRVLYNLIGDCYLYIEDLEVWRNTWRLCSVSQEWHLWQPPDSKPSQDEDWVGLI
ncbi:hypothetical protein MAPG_04662 [Magnaporthiopsis poae ATCC 64411]|uniref:Heterokaryon incompatibility domain-containing protein n=1 Tax=Magnaporthiopsis poae (strain ATCC 64411 / 73-15) TaxID=644358 RepID=A0A0C4DXC0_MAGP6|nr:hypothetical protein MAPG_04662 [Magnaporthiopsis poae ATCC 64411]